MTEPKKSAEVLDKLRDRIGLDADAIEVIARLRRDVDAKDRALEKLKVLHAEKAAEATRWFRHLALIVAPWIESEPEWNAARMAAAEADLREQVESNGMTLEHAIALVREREARAAAHAARALERELEAT